MSKVPEHHYVRGPYDVYDPTPYAKRFPPDDPNSRSCTKQSFRDDVDINTIVGRWIKTGVNPHPARTQPRWGDFLDGVEYQELLLRVTDAQSDFEALPSQVRARFMNDPKELLEFLADESNQAEAVALGLAEPPREGTSSGPSSGDSNPNLGSNTPNSSPPKPAQNEANSPPAVGGKSPTDQLST